jgi:hypothetical protein
MTDDDITRIWDSLNAEAFDGETLIRFARAIEDRVLHPGPKHYRMVLETGQLGVKRPGG